MDQNKSNEEMNAGLVEHLAGNLALYNMAKKYFPVICAGIFSLILASDTLPNIKFPSSEAILGGYLIAGLLGLFQYELRNGLNSVTGWNVPLPEFLKRIFVVYTMMGFLIFSWLLLWHISQKVAA
ncbi:MAG: hypothetical protein V4751_11030 [Pseudomonadota bacterium]